MVKDITAMMFRATDIEVMGTVIVMIIEEATAVAAVTARTSFIFPAK